MGNDIDASCRRCGGSFMATRSWHRFCSDACRAAYRRSAVAQQQGEARAEAGGTGRRVVDRMTKALRSLME